LSEGAGDKRVTPRNLLVAVLVVAAIQLFAVGMAYGTAPAYQAIVNETGPTGPAGSAGSTPAGSALNVVFLVGLAFGATLVLVWVLRRKMVKSFKGIIFASLAASAFLLNLVTVDAVMYQYVPPGLETPIVLGTSLALVALLAYTIFVKNKPLVSTVVLSVVGAEVGTFFALTLPLATALALPLAFAAYDVYAVFRGPLKQLIGIDAKVALTGMSIRAGEFTLGLGDVVFYTMLPAVAFWYSPFAAAPYATMLAMDAGVAVTLFLLSRRRLLPGLPIPVLLGFLVLLSLIPGV
jgi:hypothetical protein